MLDFELLINCTFSLGYIAKDSSFYASLHAESSQQDQVISQTEMETSNSNATIKYRLVQCLKFNVRSVRAHKFFKTPHMTKKFCVRSAHKEILLSDY